MPEPQPTRSTSHSPASSVIESQDSPFPPPELEPGISTPPQFLAASADAAPAPPAAENPNLALSSLALLSPAEYDRVRRSEAKRLNLRLRTLDDEIETRRCRLADDAAGATLIPSVTPWPEPIANAPDLFDQVAECYSRRIVLPPGGVHTLALFTGHTHAVNAFHLSPRLNLFSREGGCGKTTTLDVLHTLVPRPLRAENLNSAVIFRLIDQHQPTFELDEVDAWLTKDPEIRGLLNAGHKAGSHAYRCEGSRGSVRAFKAFAPVVLAGVRSLPPTLQDRSITLVLTKPANGETYFRFDPQHVETESRIARQLARWAQDNFAALKAADPALPSGASHRVADNWRPLFAIAQIAGGHWPERAARAFELLNAPPAPSDGLAHALLDDIRLIFTLTGANRLFSTQLAEALRDLPGRPWSASSSPDKPFSAARLARLLAALNIQPQAIRIGATSARGYLFSAFRSQPSGPDFEI